MNLDYRVNNVVQDKRIINKVILLVVAIFSIIIINVIYRIYENRQYVNEEDKVGPKIVSVTASNADGVYTINQDILVTLEFNEEIIVDMINPPRLLLQLDKETRYAEYVDDGSRSSMTFKYSVLKGDSAKFLNYASEDSLDARGTRVTDKSGNESSLLMPLATSENSLKATRKIRIDTNEPYPIVYSEDVTTEIKKYTIIFNRKIKDFTIDDITATFGEKESFTEIVPSLKYEVYVSKNSANEQSIFIEANTCKDLESSIGNSASVIIPEGFYYCGGTKNTGLVVSDSYNDRNLDFYEYSQIVEKVPNGMYGNSFVWVPIDYINDTNGTVENESVLGGRFGNRKFANASITTNSSDQVPAALITSVKKYKGFFVGRYEGSYGEKGELQSKASVLNVNDEVGRTSEKDKVSIGALYNYLTASNASSAINKLYGSSSKVVAHLPYSAEYDTLLQWLQESKIDVIEDSSSWGNYYNSNLRGYKESDLAKMMNSGSCEQTKQKNIYDLAGNLWEWSQEKATLQTARGGCYETYGYSSPASYKKSMDNSSLKTCGARVFLYIK